MTNLYLIRHGRQLSADAPDERWIPEEQNALSERGHAQARQLGQYLAARIKPAVLYASPVLRAQQTAQAVSDATGLPIRFDDRLRESRLNLPSDMTSTQIMKVWSNMRRCVDQPVSTGSETWLDLQRRAVEVIKAIVAADAGIGAHPDQKVAVVTHGGIIETLFFHFLGIPNERNSQVFISVRHTGIFHWRNFQFEEHQGWELLSANDMRHLDSL